MNTNNNQDYLNLINIFENLSFEFIVENQKLQNKKLSLRLNNLWNVFIFKYSKSNKIDEETYIEQYTIDLVLKEAFSKSKGDDLINYIKYKLYQSLPPDEHKKMIKSEMNNKQWEIYKKNLFDNDELEQEYQIIRNSEELKINIEDVIRDMETKRKKLIKKIFKSTFKNVDDFNYDKRPRKNYQFGGLKTTEMKRGTIILLCLYFVSFLNHEDKELFTSSIFNQSLTGFGNTLYTLIIEKTYEEFQKMNPEHEELYTENEFKQRSRGSCEAGVFEMMLLLLQGVLNERCAKKDNLIKDENYINLIKGEIIRLINIEIPAELAKYQELNELETTIDQHNERAIVTNRNKELIFVLHEISNTRYGSYKLHVWKVQSFNTLIKGNPNSTYQILKAPDGGIEKLVKKHVKEVKQDNFNQKIFDRDFKLFSDIETILSSDKSYISLQEFKYVCSDPILNKVKENNNEEDIAPMNPVELNKEYIENIIKTEKTSKAKKIQDWITNFFESSFTDILKADIKWLEGKEDIEDYSDLISSKIDDSINNTSSSDDE